MSIVSINKNPSPRELKVFGLGLVPFSAAFAGLMHLRNGSDSAALTVLGVGVALALVYLALPAARRWIYLGWVYVTFPIGWTISHLVMGLVYYGVLTPIALLLRATGRDALKLRLDRNAASYWTPHDPGGRVERYFRQF